MMTIAKMATQGRRPKVVLISLDVTTTIEMFKLTPAIFREGGPMQFMSLTEAVELIQLEYAEMPELRLTFTQAQRLWNLSEELCERALTALMGSGFLVRTPDGSYVRRRGLPTSAERCASLIDVNRGAIR